MIERSPRGAEEFRLSDEDVDGDSEKLVSPRTVLLLPDHGAESENWVETEVFTVPGNEAELLVTPADVLLWARNQRAVLSAPLREDLETAPVRDVEVELPFWSSGLLASCRSAEVGESFCQCKDVCPNSFSVAGSVNPASPGVLVMLPFPLDCSTDGEAWTAAEVVAALESSGKPSVSFTGRRLTAKDRSILEAPSERVEAAACARFV